MSSNAQGQCGMARKKPQRGVGLVEVMLALLILLVGLLTLLSLFTQAIATTRSMQMDMIARQKVRETLESIFTARNIQQIGFEEIQNAENGGIFIGGSQPLRAVGPDGLAGTGDDGAVEAMHLPGGDGVMNTSDDELVLLDRFQREILIEPVLDGEEESADLRRVTITITYTNPMGVEREYRVESYISRYR